MAGTVSSRPRPTVVFERDRRLVERLLSARSSIGSPGHERPLATGRFQVTSLRMSDAGFRQGATYPRYLLWHPRDHIHWELVSRSADGGTGQGARFRIVEAFAANPDYYVDSTDYVEKLDEEGISLVRRVLGTEIFRLEHRFGTVREGASYRSRLVFGAACGGFGRILNAVLRREVFSYEMGTAWLTHNVEEVGMFEHILPPLYACR
jgi:hypothetical protein